MADGRATLAALIDRGIGEREGESVPAGPRSGRRRSSEKGAKRERKGGRTRKGRGGSGRPELRRRPCGAAALKAEHAAEARRAARKRQDILSKQIRADQSEPAAGAHL